MTKHDDTSDMKTMNLYKGVSARIYNELKAAGLEVSMDEDTDAGKVKKILKISDLTPFDQLHYHGTEAVDQAGHYLRLYTVGEEQTSASQVSKRKEKQILDVGAGIGGPARYLVQQANYKHKTCRCVVTALELQEDLNDLAQRLTDQCQLSADGTDDKTVLRHVCADALHYLTLPENQSKYDGIFSFLTLYHIPGNPTDLWRLFYNALKKSDGNDEEGTGRIVVEDLYLRQPPPPDSPVQNLLDHKLKAGYLCTSLDEYSSHVKAAGFTIISVEDMSKSWTGFTSERFDMFMEKRDWRVEIHGEEAVASMEDFYRMMRDFFRDNVVGGVRIVAVADVKPN